MPRLSIIVPVYKVEKYIDACLNSILNQTYKDFELILVDDGSPDNCGEICDEYASRDKRIKVIHKQNGGLSSARNAGLDIAKGEIIGFVDSDDTIALNMYSEMLEYMDNYQCDIVCGDVYIVRGDKKRFKPRYIENKVFNKDEAICEILNGTLDNAAPNKIYKRNVIADIRYPQGRVYEDVATTYKFIFNAQKVCYISKPYYNYFKREGSIVASAFNSKSRYDNFIGHRERYDFAKTHSLICVNDCERLALEVALNTLTAFYANDEENTSIRWKDINSFINEHINSTVIYKMRRKQQFLLWSFENSKILHKIYAKLSGISKKR